jgi:hypothetical protein
MSTRNPLEGSDYYLDQEYAAMFGQELPTFRGKVRKLQIPHLQWGHTLVISRTVLLEHMKGMSDDEEKDEESPR